MGTEPENNLTSKNATTDKNDVIAAEDNSSDSYDASTDGHAHDPDKDEPSTSSARSKVTTRSRHHEHNEGFLAGVAIGGIALYRKFWYKSLHTIYFDNPVYRKTTEEN